MINYYLFKIMNNIYKNIPNFKIILYINNLKILMLLKKVFLLIKLKIFLCLKIVLLSELLIGKKF